MLWAVAALVLLVVLIGGLFLGLRDIPPNGRSGIDNPGGRQTIYERTWKSVNDHFARRKRLGR